MYIAYYLEFIELPVMVGIFCLFASVLVVCIPGILLDVDNLRDAALDAAIACWWSDV